MAVTTTPAPWRGQRGRPSSLPVASGTAAIRRYRPVFLDGPRGSLGGQTIPLTKAERHDRPAPSVRTTSPGRVARVGPCTAGTGGGPWAHGQAHIPRADGTSLATGGGRIGPNRSADRSADPLPAMASDQGWAWRSCIRCIRQASSGCANGTGRCWSRVVSVPFPVPGRGLACPVTGPGKAVLAVG